MSRTDSLRGLYPDAPPYREIMLDVGDGHSLYVSESGNPAGKPALFLHGGPGGCTETRMQQLFDPELYRTILFDQRGCGRSRPFASTQNNTTWKLIADIELIRASLGIDRFLVGGGSWGSTLALAYAQEHPDRVSEILLQGVFLVRRGDIRFFYQEGASHLYPDLWETFVAPVPEGERDDMVAAYARIFASGDDDRILTAARAWTLWENATSTLRPVPAYIEDADRPESALPLALIENHYFSHDCFFPGDDFLTGRIDRIRHIPAAIVQGRYDLVCPMKQAWDLHRAWPEAELVVVDDEGHDIFEPRQTDEVVRILNRFAGKQELDL